MERKKGYFNTLFFVIGVILFSLSKIYHHLFFDFFYIYYSFFGLILGLFHLSGIRESVYLRTWYFGLLCFSFANLLFINTLSLDETLVINIANFLFVTQVLTKQAIICEQLLGISNKIRVIILLNLAILIVAFYFLNVFSSGSLIDYYFLIESGVSFAILLVINFFPLTQRIDIKYAALGQFCWLVADFEYLERLLTISHSTDFMYFLGFCLFIHQIWYKGRGLKLSILFLVPFSVSKFQPTG